MADKKDTHTKNITPIVSGKVRTQKANAGKKFADTFINEDLENVKSYAVWDVIVPTLKNAFSELVSNCVDMVLFGETRSKSKKNKSGYYNYNSLSSGKSSSSHERRNTRRYDDIVLDDRREAEDVLNRLLDILDEYEVVSVADLYELCGMRSEYTDQDYGWEDLTRARIQQVRGGWLLDMPRAVYLKR